MLIVGVSGAARSGKDTAAAILKNTFGFSRIALADGLRDEAFKVFQPTLQAYVRTVYAPVCTSDSACDDMIRFLMTQQKDAFMRSFLQRYGTDLRRAENPDYWVEILDSTIRRHFLTRVVVPDVRFENEAQYIKSRGGFVILTKRPGYGGNPEGAGMHVSEEFALSDYPWDAVLDAGDVRTLKSKTLAWANEVLRPRILEAA